MENNRRDELAELRRRRAAVQEPERPEWYSAADAEQELDIKRRHDMKRRRMRKRFIMRRTIAGGVVCVVFAVLIVLISSMFGMFDARILVKYEGTKEQKVTNEELGACLSELNRMSVFKISDGMVKKAMEQIPYINTEEMRIEKKYIPASVTIYYTETTPYGYIKLDNSYITFDRDGAALEIGSEAPENIPRVESMADMYDSGKNTFKIGETRADALLLCLRKMDEHELLGGVTTITVDEDEIIRFVYEDRYTVNCGSSYEISEKLGLFKSSVNHGEMIDSPRGNFDLSEPGKATYSP